MILWFVGMEVVCVVDRERLKPAICGVHSHCYGPDRNNVYTVTGIVMHHDEHGNEGVYLQLEDFAGARCGLCGKHAAWHEYGFKPVTKDRLKVFRDLLAPTPSEIRRLREKV